MNIFKKILILIFFFGIINFINADIVDKLLESNYVEIIRPYASNAYVGTLIVKNNKLNILFESEGLHPTIMAYKINSDRIHLIIKSRPIENSRNINSIFYPEYYEITLYIENDKIKYSCYLIGSPYLIIDGYIFNKGIIIEENVNIRTKPGLDGEIFCKINKGYLAKIIAINNNYENVARMIDYWLEINIEEKNYWVFGYYVDFLQEITLK